MITYQDVARASSLLKKEFFPQDFWNAFLESRSENELLRQLIKVFPPKNYKALELKTKDSLLFKQENALLMDAHDGSFELARYGAESFLDHYYTTTEIDELFVIENVKIQLLKESEELKEYFDFIIDLFHQKSTLGRPLYSRKNIFIALLDYFTKISSLEDQTEAYQLFIDSLEECRTSYPETDRSRPFYPKLYSCMGGLIDCLLIKFDAYLDSLNYKIKNQMTSVQSEEAKYAELIYQDFLRYNEHNGLEPTDLLYHIYSDAIEALSNEKDNLTDNILFQLKSGLEKSDIWIAYQSSRKRNLDEMLRKNHFDSVQEKLMTLNNLKKYLKVDEQGQFLRPIRLESPEIIDSILRDEFEKSFQLSVDQGPLPTSLLIKHVPEFFDSTIFVESTRETKFSKYKHLHEKKLIEKMAEKSGLSIDHLKLILDLLGNGAGILEEYYIQKYEPKITKQEALENLEIIKHNLLKIGKILLQSYPQKYHLLMLMDSDLLLMSSSQDINQIVKSYSDDAIEKIIFETPLMLKDMYRSHYAQDYLVSLFFKEGHPLVMYRLLSIYPFLISDCYRFIEDAANNFRFGFLYRLFEIIAADVEHHLEQYDNLSGYNKDWLGVLIHLGLRLNQIESIPYVLKEEFLCEYDSYGMTPLHWAVQLKQNHVLKKMLVNLSIASITTLNEETLTHYAAMSGNLSALYYLDQMGLLSVQINQKDLDSFTPVLNAIMETIKNFYETSIQSDLTSESLAQAENQALEQITYLFEAGADLKVTDSRGYNVLMRAVEETTSMRSYRLLEILMKYANKTSLDINYVSSDGESVLSIAIKKKNAKLVHYFLRKGANPLLIEMVADIPVSIQKILLQAGSKEIPPSKTFLIDLGGPLEKKEQIYYLSMSLLKRDYLRSAIILNRLHIDPSDHEDAHLIFMIAQYGTPNLMDILLDRSGQWAGLLYIDSDQIDRRDKEGKTCLHYACSSNNIEMISHLLSRYSSNPALMDDDGLLAEDYCQDLECKDLLRKARGDYREGFFEYIHNVADTMIFSPIRIYHKKNNQTVDEFCQEHQVEFDNSGWPFFFKI